MRRILTITVFILVAFFSITKVTFAEDLTLQDCIVAKEGYGSCRSFIDEVRKCLSGQKGKLSSTVFDPKTYNCVDASGSVDMAKCKVNFATYVCQNATPKTNGWGQAGTPGNCSSVTELSGQPVGDKECGTRYSSTEEGFTEQSYFDVFGILFERNYNNTQVESGITPTPIPLPTDGIPTIDICFDRARSQVYTEEDFTAGYVCTDSTDNLKRCLNETRKYHPEEFDRFSNGAALVTAITDVFKRNPATNRCLNETDGAFQKRVDALGSIKTSAAQRETATANGASSDALEGGISLDLEDLYSKVGQECGVGANAPGTLGNSCCENPTDVILPQNSNLRIPTSVGDPDDEGGGNGFLENAWNAITYPFAFLTQALTANIQESVKDYIDVDSRFYCKEGSPDKTYSDDGSFVESCMCQGPESRLAELCETIDNSTERENSCKTCVLPKEKFITDVNGNQVAGKGGYWTAIGCVDSNIETFIQNTIFGWGLGLAGITALLCVIYASFQLQMSANNPEQIKGAQELLTSCITGLIVIIFSVVILRIIGVDILRLPFLN